jgi:hypothetical protein
MLKSNVLHEESGTFTEYANRTLKAAKSVQEGWQHKGAPSSQ